MERPSSQASCEEATRTRFKFNILPPELRLKIYAFTWEPRRVAISRIQEFEESRQVREVLKLSSPTPPVTLRLNLEARQLTLRHYVPCYRSDTDVLYINPAIDVLHLDHFPTSSEYRHTARLREAVSTARYIHIQAQYNETRALVGLAAAGGLPNLRVILRVTYTRSERPDDELSRLYATRLCANPGCILGGGANRWCAMPVTDYENGEFYSRFLTCEDVALGMREMKDLVEVRMAEATKVWELQKTRGQRDGEELEELLSFHVKHFSLDDAGSPFRPALS